MDWEVDVAVVGVPLGKGKFAAPVFRWVHKFWSYISSGHGITELATWDDRVLNKISIVLHGPLSEGWL